MYFLSRPPSLRHLVTQSFGNPHNVLGLGRSTSRRFIGRNSERFRTPRLGSTSTVSKVTRQTTEEVVEESGNRVKYRFFPRSRAWFRRRDGKLKAKIVAKVFSSAVSTAVSLAMVFLGGTAYVRLYKNNVTHKMEASFAPGYDPAMELARRHTPQHHILDEDDWESEGSYEDFPKEKPHVRRKEQDLIDSIVQGKDSGNYYFLLGPKGTGKGAMLHEAMETVNADGVSMCDVHPDLEIFRLRLGKALNYKFNEDSQTSLFQRRDPRDGGAALDIERAFQKLEKVAIVRAKVRNKPLVLIINNVHVFDNDEAGRNILLQLQQKAESWAAGGLVTMVFTSDDYWPFSFLHKTARRMHVLAISDLEPHIAVQACRTMRFAQKRSLAYDTAIKAVEIIGGRLSYLHMISRAPNMLRAAEHLQKEEEAWLLSQIGLIKDCDDDAVEEQKWSTCSWLLLQAFVRKRREQEQQRIDAISRTGSEVLGLEPLPMPAIPFHECRQIMTRTDFLEELDRLSIITIDRNHDVRPDSLLILNAAAHVVEGDGFQKLLDSVRTRIASSNQRKAESSRLV